MRNLRAASVQFQHLPGDKTANLQKALLYLKTTVVNARELGQTEYILAFAEVLSDAYRMSGDNKNALSVYKDYISIRDSVYNVEKYNAATRSLSSASDRVTNRASAGNVAPINVVGKRIVRKLKPNFNSRSGEFTPPNCLADHR